MATTVANSCLTLRHTLRRSKISFAVGRSSGRCFVHWCTRPTSSRGHCLGTCAGSTEFWQPHTSSIELVRSRWRTKQSGVGKGSIAGMLGSIRGGSRLALNGYHPSGPNPLRSNPVSTFIGAMLAAYLWLVEAAPGRRCSSDDLPEDDAVAVDVALRRRAIAGADLTLSKPLSID